MSLEILGVDLGRVIVEGFITNDFLPVVKGAFESIKRLREKRFSQVHVVSWVPLESEKAVWSWLEARGFYQATGLTKEQVHFCTDRKDKAPICERLGVTHFIDDRLEVLGYLHQVGIKNLYLFRGQEEEAMEHLAMLGYVKTVGSWQDVLEWLL